MDQSKEHLGSKTQEVIEVPFRVKSSEEVSSGGTNVQPHISDTSSRLDSIRRRLTGFMSSTPQQEVLPSTEIEVPFERTQTLEGPLGELEVNLLSNIRHHESIIEEAREAASKQTAFGRMFFNREEDAKRMIGEKLDNEKYQLKQLRNGNPQPAIAELYKEVEKEIRGLTFAVRRNSDFVDSHINIVNRSIAFISKIDPGTAAQAREAFHRALDGKY